MLSHQNASENCGLEKDCQKIWIILRWTRKIFGWYFHRKIPLHHTVPSINAFFKRGCFLYPGYIITLLEDDPRSTPGHSKVLDQIGAIMELMILASRVGLTKKLLRCYVDVQKHLKQLLKYPQSLSSFIHLLRFELYTH